jgi:glutamate/aspartate transport system substrate-binding protein
VVRGANIDIIKEKNNNDVLKKLLDKKADAIVADDFLLLTIRSLSKGTLDFYILEENLSIIPIAIMIKKNDTTLKNSVDKAMIEMIDSGTLNLLYEKWFQNPILPKNKSLNEPPSALLKDIFRMPTYIIGNN